jgi:hypothetical protein
VEGIATLRALLTALMVPSNTLSIEGRRSQLAVPVRPVANDRGVGASWGLERDQPCQPTIACEDPLIAQCEDSSSSWTSEKA